MAHECITELNLPCILSVHIMPGWQPVLLVMLMPLVIWLIRLAKLVLLRANRCCQRDRFYSSLNMADSRKLFSKVRQLRGQSRPPTTQLQFDGCLFKGSSILLAWARYFSELALPSSYLSFDDTFHPSVINKFASLASLPYAAPPLFSLDDVTRAVFSVPCGKSSGPDSVQAEHLRFYGPILLSWLTSIFNSIHATGVVPASLAYGYVIPLLKSSDKDPSVPSNYRGITLIPVISKVFEHLLLSRLLPYIQLRPLQGGFRVGRSCTHTAFVLQKTIAYLHESGRKIYLAFLDARKAFDTVWHEGLFVKLDHAGIPLSLWHILLSWYCQCRSSVLWEHSCSPSFPIRQGVHQGAVLSPLL